jgi:predicted amidohydrolase
MAVSKPSRRRCLAALGGGLAGALAGCAGVVPTEDTDELAFERLQRTAVYVGAGVELAFPEEVQTVRATENADLLVLRGDNETDAEQVVEWLTDDRKVALLGEAAEPTWLDWASSDPYQDAFGRGLGDADRDPQLLVADADGTDVTTYRRTWADGPRDRDLLRALDEILVAARTETPD